VSFYTYFSKNIISIGKKYFMIKKDCWSLIIISLFAYKDKIAYIYIFSDFTQI